MRDAHRSLVIDHRTADGRRCVRTIPLSVARCVRAICVRSRNAQESGATPFLMNAQSCRQAVHWTARMRWCFLLILLAGGCLTSEQSVPSPDLIAVPDGSFGGPDAFCDMTSVPQLRIVIQNQAEGAAPSSITRVSFSPGGSVNIPTAPLQSAQRTVLAPVPIPTACFDPDCDFTITVDANAKINETTGEENNVTEGRCIRP